MINSAYYSSSNMVSLLINGKEVSDGGSQYAGLAVHELYPVSVNDILTVSNNYGASGFFMISFYPQKDN